MAPWTAWLLAACFVSEEDRAQAYDRDLDGFEAEQVGGGDCEDGDPNVYPGAFESCLDDIDSDCDDEPCPVRVDTDLEIEAALTVGMEIGDRLQATGIVTDLNGDGVEALVINVPWARKGQGDVTLFTLPLGGDPGLPMAPEASYYGDQSAGLWAHDAGDLDGDGVPEVLLSTLSQPAVTYLLEDLGGGEASVEGLLNRLEAPDFSDGETTVYGDIQPLGDRDGDGLGEYLVLSPGDSGGETLTGAAFLVEGPPDGVQNIADRASSIIHGRNSGDMLGANTGAAADLDGDGRLDPVLVAPGEDFYDADTPDEVRGEDLGAVYVFLAPPEGSLLAIEAEIELRADFQTAPIVWAGGLGDTNGDGYDDLGVGVAGGVGDMLVFLGPLDDAEGRPYFHNDADLRLFGGSGETPTRSFGAYITSADIDDDGDADLLVAAPYEGSPNDEEYLAVEGGAVYLFHSPAEGVLGPDHASARWRGPYTEGHMSGISVLDADGDGALDLLLSAPDASRAPSALPGEGNGAVHLLSSPFEGIERQSPPAEE